MKPFNNVIVSATEPEQKSDVWIKYAENIIHNKWRDGFRVGLDGNLFADTNYSTTDFIEVNPNTKYIANWELEATQCIGYYNSEKIFISRNTTDNAFTTPNNCKYIRASRLTSDKDIAKITLFEADDDILINNDGIYNSIFNMKDYALNKERKIGKWINGEDLYQLIFKDTTPEVQTDGTIKEKIIDISNLNIKDAFIEQSIVFYKDNRFLLPFINNAGKIIKIYYRGNQIVLACNDVIYNNSEILIVLNYTKN